MRFAQSRIARSRGTLFSRPSQSRAIPSGCRKFFSRFSLLTTECLERRGLRLLRQRIQSERTQIAIRYLNQLESDYEALLEASRILAVMSPEIVAMQKFERLRLSVRFAQNCFLMRLRLRAGFAPWKGFATISDMATTMSFPMESATSQIALQSARAADSASFMEERGGGR
jgi:hypothetical protein